MAKVKIRGLDCSAPADKMIRVVLRAQVRAMCRYRDAALNWKDPEGVHDMRVLSRRLRSAINDFRRYFRKGSLPRPELRAIAAKLGNVRDEDVALMTLKELATQTKGKAEVIQLITAQRKERRKKARVELKQALTQATVTEFQKDFLARLETIVIAVPSASRSPQPATESLSFRALGVQVIRQRLKDFNTAGSCLYVPYEVKDHHELRILAKRLRYSVELFSVCWGKEFAAWAKEVAQLQTSLGELHDCDIWIAELGTWLKRLARKATLEPHEVKMRAGATWLLKHLAADRMRHYRDALATWEQWQADGFIEQLEHLLDSDSTTAKAAPQSKAPT
jgi:CHAD domain-containing protein